MWDHHIRCNAKGESKKCLRMNKCHYYIFLFDSYYKALWETGLQFVAIKCIVLLRKGITKGLPQFQVSCAAILILIHWYFSEVHSASENLLRLITVLHLWHLVVHIAKVIVCPYIAPTFSHVSYAHSTVCPFKRSSECWVSCSAL